MKFNSFVQLVLLTLAISMAATTFSNPEMILNPLNASQKSLSNVSSNSRTHALVPPTSNSLSSQSIISHGYQNENTSNESTLQQNHSSVYITSLNKSRATSYPNWLELAQSSMNAMTIGNGTLQVNAKVGSIMLNNANVLVYNTTNKIVANGRTDINGNYTISLQPGLYTVIIRQTTNMTFTTVNISSLTTTQLIANFGYLQIITKTDTNVSIAATVSLLLASDDSVQATNVNTGSNGNITLIVANTTYNVIANTTYAQTNSNIVVTAGQLTTTTFVFGSITGKFGGLYITTTGFDTMPVSTSVVVKYYTTGTSTASGSTSSITGAISLTLAPDVYNVELTKTNTYIFTSVSVTANVQTNLTFEWGVLLVYNTTVNTLVQLYDATNTQYLTYGYTGSNDLVAFQLSPGQYTVRYSSQNIPVTVTAGNRTLIGSEINTPVSVVSVTSSPARIYANQQTNLTITVTDVNYDYKNMSFSWTPNVGTITGQNTWNRFTQENQYTSTVTYHAPSTNQTMYIDIFVNDGYGGNFTYRIYVWNQKGNLYINSTALNGIGRPNELIYLYAANTGVEQTYTYTNASGWAVFNVYEDKYYLQASEGNVQTSSIIFLAGNVISYYNFQWGVLEVNASALNDALVATGITVYDSTGQITQTSGTTSTTGNGTITFYLKTGNYSLKAQQANSILKYNISVTAQKLTTYEFKFGVLAVYYLTATGSASATQVDFYNGTSNTYLFYGYTTTQGIGVFIVAPFVNYTIQVNNGSNWIIYNFVSVSANQGIYIGPFFNHAPAITAFSASPATVNPTNSTTITVTATDPDPLDTLTYIYTPSMGLIVGSGSVVTYIAPATAGFYYLNITVKDNHGATYNITRSLSARSIGLIVVTVKGFLNQPLNGMLVYLYDWTTTTENTYAYTNASGIAVFNSPSIKESFYYLIAEGSNAITSVPFIAYNIVQYNYTFTFGAVFVNSVGGQSQYIATPISLYNTGSGTSFASGTTLTTGNGQIRFNVNPENYDLHGQMINDQWYKNFTVNKAQAVNLTFNWAEINFTVITASEMPLNSLVYLYNATTKTEISYTYASSNTGNGTFIVRQSNDYQLQVVGSATFYINTTAQANQVTYVPINFGVLRVTNTDSSGKPNNVSIYVYNQTTNILVTSGSTGSTGVIIFNLPAGTYKVYNGSYYYTNIVVTALLLTSVGPSSVDNAPVIVLVTASPARIGPSSSTVITLQAQDIDFDYATFNINIQVNMGTLGSSIHGWSTTNTWFYQVQYFSPATTGLYQLNITLSDGRGMSATYMLVVSNGIGKLNVLSLGNLLHPLQNIAVQIVQVNIGQIINNTSTNSLGLASFYLYDGLYTIHGISDSTNNWVYNIWIKAGQTVNLTLLWGQITLYSSGVNEVPLSNTLVYVYNQTSNTEITYGYTDGSGKVSFILASGIYKFILQQTNSITLSNITIIGGSGLYLGSYVPVISSGSDFSYVVGSSGQTITWTLSDPHPDYYNITLDGVLYLGNTHWSNGQIVVISASGLSLGNHTFVIYVNNTYGYVQISVIHVTVITDTIAPTITTPTNLLVEAHTTGNTLTYTVSDINPGKYVLFRNGTSISSGTWANGNLIFNIDGLVPGVYSYQLEVNDIYGNTQSSGITMITVYTAPLAVLSSPADISVYTTDANVVISWTATIYEATANGYTLYVDSAINTQASYSNNSLISFDVSAMHLSVGIHNFTLVITAIGINRLILTAEDTVLVNVLVHQVIPAGTSTFTVNGTNTNSILVPVTISVNVSSSVTITIQATSSPPNSTSSAFSALGAISTGYFLQINVSDEHAIREAWINISYAGWNLATMGITEQNLRIVFFNTTSGHWELAGNTGVDTVKKVIYAHTNHFSTYSAVSFVHVPPSSTSSLNNTSSTNNNRPIPGFELSAIFLAGGMVSILTLKKRRGKKNSS